MDAKTEQNEEPSKGFSISDFLNGQLGMLSRRMSPEERARVRWYRERIALLEKQEPGADELRGSV